MAENKIAHKVPPSTVFKVQGSPDDYDYVLKGADLVLVDKNTGEEQVFLFVGNIMSLEGQVNMEFDDGQSLASNDIFSRSEMVDMDKMDDEAPEWEVVIDTKDESISEVSQREGNSDEQNLNVDLPSPGNENPASGQASVVSSVTDSVINSQADMIDEISSLARNDSLSSEVIPESANQKSSSSDSDTETEADDPDYFPENRQPEKDDPDENDDETEDEKELIPGQIHGDGTVTTPTVKLTEDSDTGVEDDNTTNLESPSFTGTADVGALVTLYVVSSDDGTKDPSKDFSLGSVIAQSAGDSELGVFTLNLDDYAFSHSDYEVYAVSTMTNADTGEAVTSTNSKTLDLTVDLVGPESTTVNLADSSDTTAEGVDDGNVYTNDNTPVLSGKGDARGTLTIYAEDENGNAVVVKDEEGNPLVDEDGNYILGTTNVYTNGSWDFVIPEELADGKYTFKVAAEDVAGNKSDSTVALENIVVKTEGPQTSLELDSASDSYNDHEPGSQTDLKTNKETITLNVSMEDGTSSDEISTVKIYKKAEGEAEYKHIGNATDADGDGIWTFEVAAEEISDEGKYDFKAIAVDVAGNEETKEISDNIISVEIDRTGPEDNLVVDLVDDSDSSGELIGDNTDDYTSGEDDLAGNRVLNLQVTDAGSEAWVKIWAVRADGTEELVTEDKADSTGTLAFSYSAENLGLNGAEVVEFRAEIMDEVGNITSNTLSVTVDRDAPDQTSISVDGLESEYLTTKDGLQIAYVKDASVTLKGLLKESGDDVAVRIYDENGVEVANSASDNGDLGDVTISEDADGKYYWTWDSVELTDGETYKYYAEVEDKAGNVSSASDIFTIEADQSISDTPTVKLASASNTYGGPGGTNSDNVTGFLKYGDGSERTTLDLEITGSQDEETTLAVYLKVPQGTANAVEISAGVYGILIQGGIEEVDGSWPKVGFDATKAAYGVEMGEVNNLEFIVTSTDKAGNVSTNLDASGDGYRIILDDADPVGGGITLIDAANLGISDTDRETNAGEITLAGQLNEGPDAVTVTIYDNGVKLGTAEVKDDGSGNYSWSYTIGDDADFVTYISEGDHSFTAVIEDNAGNQTELPAYDITIDRQISDPAFELETDTGADAHDFLTSGDLDSDNSVEDGSLTFSGSSDEGDFVTVYMKQGSGAPVAVGRFKADSDDWTYTLNKDGSFTGTNITVDNNFTPTADISADGDYTFYVETVDLAGNSKSTDADGKRIELELDRTTNEISTAPDLTDATDTEFSYTDSDGNAQTIGEENTTSSSTLEFTGSVGADAATGVEAGSTVTLYYVASGQAADPANATSVGSYTLGAGANSTTDWTISANGLPEGDYDFFITYTDKAGNVSDPSTVQAVSVDQTVPITPDIEISGSQGAEYTLGGDSGNRIFTNTQTTDFKVDNLEAGTTLVFTVDGTVVATHEVTEADITAGEYTFSHNFGADGDYTVSVQAADEAGNASASSDEVEFTLDTDPGTVNVSGLNDASDTDDTGNLGTGTDDYTSENRPTIEGTAEAGATVTLSIVNDGGIVVKTVNDIAVDSSGKWSYTVPVNESGLPDDTYTVQATATDDAGNTTPLDSSYSFTVDSTVTEVEFRLSAEAGNDTGFSDSDGYTSTQRPVFSWDDPGEDLTLTITVNDENGDPVAGVGPYTVNVSGGSSGNWTMSDSLADGAYTVEATFMDKAGNTVTENGLEKIYSIPVTVDTSDPALTDVAVDDSVDSGRDGDWLVSSDVLTDGSGVFNTLSVDGGTGDTVVTGHTLDADEQGLKLTGTSEQGSRVTVYVNGQPVEVGTEDYLTVGNSNGTWTFDLSALTVDNGGFESYVNGLSVNTVKVVVTDPAGNESSYEKVLKLDENVDAGDIRLDDDSNTGSKQDLITSVQSPELVGETEAGAVVQLYLENADGSRTLVETFEAGADGSWSYQVAEDVFPNDGDKPLEGDYNFTIEVTDAAGNVDSTTETITIDYTPPEIIKPEIELSNISDSGELGDNITNAQDLTFEGSADPGATVEIYVGGELKDTVTADGHGNFTSTVSGVIDGTHSVYAKAKQTIDGQEVSSDSDSFDLTVDRDAPEVPTVVLDSGSNTEGGPSGTDDDSLTGLVKKASGSDITEMKLNVSGDQDSTLSVYLRSDSGQEVTVNGVTFKGILIENVEYDGSWPQVDFNVADARYGIDYEGNVNELEFVVVSTDKAGNATTNLSADEGYKITLDDADPVGGGITLVDAAGLGISDTDSETNAGEITLTGQLDEGAADVKVTIYDNGNPVGEATVVDDGNGNYSWSYTVGDDADSSTYISEGDHSFTAVIEDNAGNQTELSAYDISIDRQISDPTFELATDTGVSDSDGITSGDADSGNAVTDGSLTFNGTSDSGDTVTVFMTGPDGTKIEVGSFKATSDNWTYTISPDGTVSGTGITDSTTSADFDNTSIAADGDYTFYVETEDAAGNTATTDADGKRSELELDRTTNEVNTAPDLTDATDTEFSYTDSDGNPQTIGDENNTSSSTLEFTGSVGGNESTGVEAGSTVTLYYVASGQAADPDSATSVGSYTLGAGANSTTDWTISANGLPEGDYDFFITYTDRAGNVSEPSAVQAVTVDTTAPVTPNIEMSGSEGADYTLGGESGNDIYTNTQATDFKVDNLEAGTTLVFSVGGTVVATHEVSEADIAAGNYVFSHTFGADGDYTVSVRAVDEAGNVSTSSDEVEFTLDTAAEAVTVSGIDTASDSDDVGNLGTDSDDYTNDTRPNIGGTAEAGSTVTLNIVAADGTVVRTVNNISADADGSWNYAIPDGEAELADGTYTVKVTATDYAGNTTPENDAYSFTVDTEVNVSDFKLEGTDGTSSANFTSDTSPVFEWTVGDEPADKQPTATITITGTTTAGDAYSKVFTVNGADSHYGNWPLPEELADGNYTVSASFEDAAGNTVSLDSVNVTVDTSSPSEADDYEDPRLSADSDTGEAGDWMVSSQVLENQTGDANDLTINDSTQTASVSEHNFDANRGLELTGKAEAGSSVVVYVNNQLVQSDGADSITVNADGTWTYNLSGLTVDDGQGNGGLLEAYQGGKSTNTIRVEISDQAGNTSTFNESLVVDKDVVPSTIDLTDETNSGSTGDMVTDVTNPVLTGETEAGAVVQIFNWEGLLIETILADENSGEWTSSPITDFPTQDGSVVDGKYEFTVKVTDRAGNVSESSATVELDFTPPETAKPTLELTDEADTGVKGDDTTKLSRPAFEGTADPDATVDIYVDGVKVVADVDVDINGEFSVDFASLGLDALTHGDHNVYAVAKLSDTVTSTSDILGLTVDLVAPDLPTVELSSGSNTTTGDVPDGIYYTSDKTPTLQGKEGDPGSTLTIYYTGEDGMEHELGTTTVVGDGSWGYTVPTGLADGTYSFRVTAVDIAGNESDPNATSKLENVVVKTDSPMTSLSLDAGSDSFDTDAGGTDADKETNAETIKLNVGMANSTELDDVASVEIFKVDTTDGSRVSLGQATLVDGTWTFTVANEHIADDGTYRFMAEATDVAGNVEALYSNTYEDVVIDRTAPETTPAFDLADSSDTAGETIGDNADDYTQGEDNGSGGKQVVLNGSAAGANAWVDVYVTRGDGSEVFVERVKADGAGKWTTTYDTTAVGKSGTEDLVFRAEISDAAGNTSSGNITVHVDQTAPVAASITMDGLIGEEKVEGSGKVATVQNESATLTGEIKESGDDVVVRLYQQNADGSYTEIANSSDSNVALGDVSISAGADGSYNWSYDYGNLADGDTYVFYAEVEDKAGNVSVRSDIYTVNSDRTIEAPEIVLDESSNTAGGPTGTTDDQLTGLVKNGDDKVTGIKLNVSGDSDSTLDVYLKVDSSASGAQEVTVNGVTFYGILVQGGIEINNGSWPQVTFDVSDPAYGVDYEGKTNDLSFIAVATDKAENVVSTEYSITLDDEPPVTGPIDLADSDDNGISAVDNITNAEEIVISGHIDDEDVTVVVSDNGTELSGDITITEDAVNGGYKWEYTVKNADLGEGDHTFTATIQDNAGNTTEVKGDDALTVSIDRSISTPTFELVTDTGRVNDDGVTHGDMDPGNSVADDSLSFSGTSDVGDMVTVYMKNGAGSPVEVGRFTATSDSWTYTLNSDGTFSGEGINPDSSFSPTADIATDGDYTFYVETADTAGNTATTNVDDKPVEVTIDRTTNDLSGNDEIDLATGSDSAYANETADGDFHTSSGDNVTNAESLVFKGSVTGDGVEAGSTVRLYYNDGSQDILVGTAVLGEGDTEWTITSSADSGSAQYIAEGTHDFFIRYEDLAGNISNSSNPLSVTVDRTLPSTPSIAMDGVEGTDYHAVTLDGEDVVYTNDVDRTLTISNLEEGTYLNIKVNGQLVTPAPQVDGSGSYTFDPVSVLGTDADGEEYTITVTSVDQAGNESGEASFSYVLDTKAEAVSGVGLENASDSNDSGSLGTNFDNLTNITTPTIEGKAEPGSIVTLRILDSDGALVKSISGIVADAATGEWSYAYDGNPELTDGRYTVEGTATDYAGNEAVFPASGSSAYSFTIDTTVADVDFRLSDSSADNDTGFSDSDGYTSNQNPVFAWNDPGEKLTMTVKVYDDNDGSADPVKTYSVLVAKGEDGSWAVPDALGDGEYTVTAEFEDAAGNKIENADGSTRIYSESITIDTTPPELSVEVSNNVDSGADNDWLISGEVLSDGNGQVNKIVGSGDSFTVIENNLGAAERGLSLSGSAEAGNRIFVYVNGVLISNADTDPSGSYLTVAESDGSWTFDLSDLTVGNGLADYVETKSTNTVRVVAVDQAGNESEFTETLIVDSGVEAGPIEIDSTDGSDTGNIGDYITSDPTPTLKGETESGAVVQLYRENGDGISTLVKTVVADGSGKWSVSVPESTFHNADGVVTGGDYTFRIDVTDKAGNVDSSSQDIQLSFAPDEPEVELVNDSEALFFGADTDQDFVTNDVDPEFRVTVEENTRLVIWRDGVQVWESTVEGEVGTATSHTFTDMGLAGGTYEYTFESIDGNGMSSTHTQSVTIDPEYADESLTLSIDDASDTGDFNPEAGVILTKDATPTLSGKAEPGSQTRIFVSGRADSAGELSSFELSSLSSAQLAALSVVAVDQNGNWTVSPTIGSDSSDDGYYRITIISEDRAGNVQTESIDIKLDTTPPDTPDLEITTDLGVAYTGDQLDGITDLTPRFEGVADTESTVLTYLKVKDADGIEVISTKVDVDAASGEWSYQVGGGGIAEWLSGGTYTAEVVSEDQAGNISTSETIAFTIDQDTGAAPTVGLKSSDDTNIDTDGITSLSEDLQPDGQLTLTGTAVAFSQVQIINSSDTVIGTVTAGENGVWSFDIAGTPAEGSYDYKVKSLSNNKTSETFTLVVDNDTPDPTIELSNDTGTLDAELTDWITRNPTLTGIVEKGSTVVITATDVTDPTKVMTVTVPADDLIKDADDNYHYVASDLSVLEDGEYSISVKTTDIAGNTKTVDAPNNLVLDSELDTPTTIGIAAGDDSQLNDADGNIRIGNNPSGTVIAKTTDLHNSYESSDSDKITNVTDLTLTGTAEAGALVLITISRDGSTVLHNIEITADGDGNWSYDPASGLGENLVDGKYIATITVRDKAGNVTSDNLVEGENTLHFEVDAQATRAADLSLYSDNDNRTSDTTPSIDLFGDSGSTYMLYHNVNGNYVLVGNGVFGSSGHDVFTVGSADDLSGTASLEEGSHTYRLVTVDEAGNVQNQNYTIEVDLTAPEYANSVSVSDASADFDDSTKDVTLYTDDNTTDLTVATKIGTSFVILCDINGNELDRVNVNSASQQATFSLSENNTTLNDGSYAYLLKFYDDVGNYDEDQNVTVNLVVDTVNPETSIDINPDSDLGFNKEPGDEILTSGNTFVFEGTLAELGIDQESSEFATDVSYLVTVTNTTTGESWTYDSTDVNNQDSEISVVENDGADTYSLTFSDPNISDGDYTVEIEASDLAGNKHASSVDFTVDNNTLDTPDFELVDYGKFSMLEGNYNVSDYAESDYEVNLIYHDKDGSDPLHTDVGNISGGSVLEVASDANTDADYLEVKVTDKAGNESESQFIDLDASDLDYTVNLGAESGNAEQNVTASLFVDANGNGIFDNGEQSVFSNEAITDNLRLDFSSLTEDVEYTLKIDGDSGSTENIRFTLDSLGSGDDGDEIFVSNEDNEQDFNGTEDGNGGEAADTTSVDNTVVEAEVHHDHIDFNIA